MSTVSTQVLNKTYGHNCSYTCTPYFRRLTCSLLDYLSSCISWDSWHWYSDKKTQAWHVGMSKADVDVGFTMSKYGFGYEQYSKENLVFIFDKKRYKYYPICRMFISNINRCGCRQWPKPWLMFWVFLLFLCCKAFIWRKRSNMNRGKTKEQVLGTLNRSSFIRIGLLFYLIMINLSFILI